MYCRVLTWFTLVHLAAAAPAQVPDSLYKSIHQLQTEHYSSYKPGYFGEKSIDLSFPDKLSVETPKMVDRKVIGWHPYWAPVNAYLSYNYNALTHIAYFSYEVDTATGGYTTIRDWNSTPIINYAHNRGTKVLLTVTNFGAARNTAILEDTIKQNTLLTNVRNLLFSRNGDGVNFDFEALPLSQRSNMVSFMQRAEKIIKPAMPNAELSIAIPAVDWSGSWDLAGLSQICDYIIIMGYDYYWRGSSTAGPVAPLAGENYNVTRTVDTYLSYGVPKEKLVLAVPWYGYDWPVVSSVRKSSATGTGTARFYTAAVTLAEAHSKTFDATTFVPWVAYLNGANWRQVWFDDEYSLKLKYELVKSKDIAGIGIWALSYEGGDPEIWDGLISSFSPYGEADDEILKLYPVPVLNNATVEFYLSARSDIRLSLFDITGKERIIIATGELPEGYHSKEFNMKGYASGLYICVLNTGNKRTNRRVIYIRQ
jgi:spore germination protein YaaH